MDTRIIRQFTARYLTLFRNRAVALLVLASLLIPGSAFSLPTGHTWVFGNGTMTWNGSTLTIKNSNGAIINWNSFSIGTGELVRFLQSSASSAVLNRVTGGNLSEIYGTLLSNGKVYLINPNGILIGRSGVVNVNGFVASTLNLGNEDFLTGRMRFKAGPMAGSIKNYGTIKTPSGGSVYLIAPQVTNGGLIASPRGDILLAAGHEVELGDSSVPGVTFKVSAADDQVVNLNTIVAEAGRIGIYGSVLKQSGVVSADSAVQSGGRVFLRATNGVALDAGSVTSADGTSGGSVTVQSTEGTTLVSGTVTATGSQGKGGAVQLLGEQVGIIDKAKVDASADAGGGSVLVGGDYRGGNAEVQNARATYIGADAVIKADAISRGNGGRVIVWSDEATRMYGSISARGGSSSGSGGFSEVSGKAFLDYQGRADLRAPQGRAGMLLLDPTDITISSSPDTGMLPFSAGLFAPANGAASNLNVTTLQGQLGLGNVTVSSSSGGGSLGNITVLNPISWTSATKLTLLADNNISLQAKISAPYGLLSLFAANNITQSAAGIIATNQLQATSTNGSVTLDAQNQVGRIAGSASGDFTFRSSSPILIEAVDAVDGVSAGAGRQVSLTALCAAGTNCGISQSAPLVAPFLSLITNGPVNLQDSGNDIGFIAADLSTGTGNFNLYSNAGITVGQLFDPIMDSTLAGITTNNRSVTITTGDMSSIAVHKAIDAGTGNVALKTTGGDVTVANGANMITGGQVKLIADTSYSDGEIAGSIAVNGGITAGDSILLMADGGFAVTGVLKAKNEIRLTNATYGTAMNINFGISDANYVAPSIIIGNQSAATGTGNITLSAPVDLVSPSSRLTLLSKDGSVSQTAAIQVNDLRVYAGGSVDLRNANNQVDKLTVNSGYGGVWFNNAKTLTVRGIASYGGDVYLDVNNDGGGDLLFAGAINASGGFVSLNVPYGSVYGSGGVNIFAGELAINAGVDIGKAASPLGTSVSLLSGFTSLNGSIFLDNFGALATGAPIEAINGSVAIKTTGPLTIGSGGISAAKSVLLEGASYVADAPDSLTLTGMVYSDTGNIVLRAGERAYENGNTLAPGGTVTILEHLNLTNSGIPSGLIPLPPPPPLFSDPGSNSLGNASEGTVVANAPREGSEGGKNSGGQNIQEDKADGKRKKQYCN